MLLWIWLNTGWSIQARHTDTKQKLIIWAVTANNMFSWPMNYFTVFFFFEKFGVCMCLCKPRQRSGSYLWLFYLSVYKPTLSPLHFHDKKNNKLLFKTTVNIQLSHYNTFSNLFSFPSSNIILKYNLSMMHNIINKCVVT